MGRILYNEAMKDHTTFKVGGPVQFLAIPNTVDEIVHAIKFAERFNIPYFILGNGSNLLVSDEGIQGMAIKIADNLDEMEIQGETIIAQAGVLLSTLAKSCAKKALTGIEFAAGIPGTLGGAITMNAGAYGGEMKDIVKWVEVLDKGEIKRLTNDDLCFEYRNSMVQKKNYIVIKICIELSCADQAKIDEKMDDLSNRRKTKQPINMPSAGSTFKRPEGYFAAQLIEEAGLKGFSLGGAKVSELHAGFVINAGGAKASDVYNLIKHIQKKVKAKSGIDLMTEVKMLGKFE